MMEINMYHKHFKKGAGCIISTSNFKKNNKK